MEADNINMRAGLCNLPVVDVSGANISKIILSQTIKWLNLHEYAI